MSLVIDSGFNYDADASAYIDAVEAADGQALETATRYAINDFVIGCKQDGIWSAIKASCILAGARTLAGALKPLAGTAPTPYFFVEGDYNRKTGLKGADSKYINSNRTDSNDPQNSIHIATYISVSPVSVDGVYIGTFDRATEIVTINNGVAFLTRNRAVVNNIISNSPSTTAGLLATSRSSSNSYNIRIQGQTLSASSTSVTPTGSAFGVFGHTAYADTTARLSFYSIGESLDLALLDARVTALMSAFAAAIP